MPNSNLTRESGTDNSDHAGAGRSGQSNPTEGPTAPPRNPDGPPEANRHRLPDERVAITHHFSIGGNEGYLTVGLYPNGQPGEVFIRMAKAGSTISGLMECLGAVTSVALQHGVPLRVLCNKLSHTRFEPSGWTGSAELGYAKSVMDYIFRWMELRFPSGKQQVSLFCVANDGKEPVKVPNSDSAGGSGFLQDQHEMEAPGETRQ
jgi:ribonucleoside-diphosphate reductase alpha chain